MRLHLLYHTVIASTTALIILSQLHPFPLHRPLLHLHLLSGLLLRLRLLKPPFIRLLPFHGITDLLHRRHHSASEVDHCFEKGSMLWRD